MITYPTDDAPSLLSFSSPDSPALKSGGFLLPILGAKLFERVTI
jgi:hypothetical protein